MSQPRKDVRVFLDVEVHAALKVIAASKDMGLGDYIEQMLVPHVRAVVHDVTLMAEQFQRSGISRSAAESHGVSRSPAESHGISRSAAE
jgi:hypothetical protein